MDILRRRAKEAVILVQEMCIEGEEDRKRDGGCNKVRQEENGVS